jgi:hypothetical protein
MGGMSRDTAPFDVERAVTDLISLKDGQDHGEAVRREMALYAGASTEKRSELERRLAVISDMPKPDRRTRSDVVAAGEKLGVKQSNVYRLLKRVENYGPVSGLLPGHRTEPKPGVANDGFGELVDLWIAEAMRLRPDASIAEIQKVLNSKAKLHGARCPEQPVVVPQQSSLRRRVHALRGDGTYGMDPARRVGESILIDQCPLDMMVMFQAADGEREERRYASVTVILDAPSSMMLGVGVFVEKDAASGLSRALSDLRTRTRSLAAEGVELADTPTTIRWVVPDSLMTAASEIAELTWDSRPPVRLEVLTNDTTRSGHELYRHLGSQLGPFRLQPRLRNETRMQAGYSPELPPTHRFQGLAKAADALAFEADMRNGRKIAALREISPDPLIGMIRADDLADALARILEPAVRNVPHRRHLVATDG